MNRDIKFYQRFLASVVIALSLLILGACQRPQNAMVASFQRHSDAILGTAAARVASAYGVYSGSSRGVASASSARGAYYGNSFYMGQYPNIGRDPYLDIYNPSNENACLSRVTNMTKSKANFMPMMAMLYQCMVRQSTYSASAQYGSSMPFVNLRGTAYWRYLSDPNGSHLFNQNMYGVGYSSAYQNNMDPVGWNNLVGLGNYNFYYPN